MSSIKRLLISALLVGGTASAQAAKVTFTPHEMFRIPFGEAREALGTKIDDKGLLLVPRDFTMDGAGHVYIYDFAKNRVARYSEEGKYEMGFHYVGSAHQIFAHADSRQNLWLMVSDPDRGVYNGVYDSNGKRLQSQIYPQYDRFRLHVDDDHTLHVILSSDKTPDQSTYMFDEDALALKKENIGKLPENHHLIMKSDRAYLIDQLPDTSKEDADHVTRISDASHRRLADIKGSVVYVTKNGEVYARQGKRQINVYSVDGSLEGKVMLAGLSAACASVRFDSEGNIYELDGIPDQADDKTKASSSKDSEDSRYSVHMPGMRFILWQRE